MIEVFLRPYSVGYLTLPLMMQNICSQKDLPGLFFRQTEPHFSFFKIKINIAMFLHQFQFLVKIISFQFFFSNKNLTFYFIKKTLAISEILTDYCLMHTIWSFHGGSCIPGMLTIFNLCHLLFQENLSFAFNIVFKENCELEHCVLTLMNRKNYLIQQLLKKEEAERIPSFIPCFTSSLLNTG